MAATRRTRRNRDGEEASRGSTVVNYIRASRSEKYSAMKSAILTIKAYLKDHYPDAVIVPAPDVKVTSPKLEAYMSGEATVIKMMDIKFAGPYDRDEFARAMFAANEKDFPKFLIVVLPGLIGRNSCTICMRRRHSDPKRV